MAVLVHDCPHCGCKKATFTIVHAQKNLAHESKGIWNFFSSCPSCWIPICGVIGYERNPKEANFNISRETPDFLVFPEMHPSKSPEHVPDVVARAFIEGADSLKDGRYTSAFAMFRRAIDLGTKEFDTEIDVFKLEKRIDTLAKGGLITKDLQAWAHKIRLDGNTIHESAIPTKEQATELQFFTELVLTYLFTLPAKVKANIRSE